MDPKRYTGLQQTRVRGPRIRAYLHHVLLLHFRTILVRNHPRFHALVDGLCLVRSLVDYLVDDLRHVRALVDDLRHVCTLFDCQ